MAEALDPSAWGAVPSEGLTSSGRIYVGPKSQAPSAESPADWGAHPQTWGDVGTDVAKSLAAGVGKGVAGIAGLPDVASEYGARGINYLTHKVGDAIGVETTDRPDQPIRYGPQFFQNQMEKVTGEFHKPETTAGKYAETVGEFAPAAMMGPGGIVRNLVTQAVVPGIASEFAGEHVAPEYEPYARVGAAVLAGGGAAAVTRPGTASRAIRSRLPEGVTEQHVNEAERLIQDAQARGVNLTWPEALSQAAGHPVLTDTMRVVESAPESREVLQRFFGERPQQFDQAGLDAMSHVAPPNANPSSVGRAASEAAQGHLNDVRQTINDAAEPFYQAAENVLLPPHEMAAVRQIPNFEDALHAVRSGPNAWRVAHLPDESVGVLNEVKKHFDTAAENAGSKFNAMRNHSTQATYEMGANAMKQVGEHFSNDYRIALDIGRQARERYLQPLMDGPLGKIANKPDTQKAISALFPDNPLANSHNEVHEAVSALARRNPWAANQLVRAYAEQTFNEATKGLQSGPNQFGAASFAKAIVGHPQKAENLRAAIQALPNGQQIWDGFNRFLEIAEATRYRQSIGSKTAFNERDLKALSAANLGKEAVKLGASPGKWWTFINDKVEKWSLGQNLNELATILTDPRSADLLRNITRMPPRGAQATAVAARLVAQGYLAGTHRWRSTPSSESTPAIDRPRDGNK